MDTMGFRYNLDAIFPKEPDFYADEEMCLKDYNYMKHLYPKQVQLCTSVVEEYMDRLEYEGSPMYVEYPDAVTIYRIAGEICKQMSWENDDKDKWMDLVQIMVCQEIYVRRRRHDHFCQKFRTNKWN